MLMSLIKAALIAYFPQRVEFLLVGQQTKPQETPKNLVQGAGKSTLPDLKVINDAKSSLNLPEQQHYFNAQNNKLKQGRSIVFTIFQPFCLIRKSKTQDFFICCCTNTIIISDTHPQLMC